MIDIIIPVLNEETILLEKKDYYLDLGHKAQIIFIDGGSHDRTVEIATNYGKVYHARPGRAIQKNVGIENSRSEFLMFLHVDTFINLNNLDVVEKMLNDGFLGGCFTMSINDDNAIFRFFEGIINFRSQVFKIIDGDLGLFVRRDVLLKIGNFDLVPYMDDIIFSRKLKKEGRVIALPQIISVSSRKWYECGFTKTFFKYSAAYFELWTGLLFFRKCPS